MKKLFILFIIYNVSLSGQTLQWYNQTNNNNVGGIGVDSIGNVWHTGVVGNAIYLEKYSSLGTLIWNDTSSFSFGAGVSGIVVDKLGNAYLAISSGGKGQKICFGNKVYSTTFTAQMYLVKYNTNGNTLWAKEFYNCGPKDLSLDQYGNLYSCGNLGPEGDTIYIDNFKIKGESFVAKFDTAGNCISAFTTGKSISSSCSDKNKGFYAVDSYYNTNPYYLKKFDSTGTLIWTKVLPGSCGRLQSDLAGNCFMFSSNYGSINWGSSSVSNPYGNNAQNCIGKIDQNGNFIWAVSSNDSLCFLNYHVSNSGIYVTGNTGYPGNPAYNAFVLKYDISTGAQLSKYILNQGKKGFAITKDQNSDIFLSGNGGPYSYVFMAKLSENATASIKEETHSSALTIFPNPTGDILNVSFKSNSEVKNIKLYLKNALGQTVYSISLQSVNNEFSEVIDLSHHAKGVYFIELVADRATEVRKVVVE